MHSTAVYSATRLAALRIVLSLLLLFSSEIPQAVHLLSEQKIAVDGAPAGFGWVLQWLGVNPSLGWYSQWSIYIGATLGLIGVYARIGFALVSAGLFYLLGTFQMHGSTIHCHHLLWFSIILTFSPCCDAFSVKSFRSSPQGKCYQLPLQCIYSTLGMMFFFPGLHKLCFGGWEWFSGETLHHTVLWKQAQYWDQSWSLSFMNDSLYCILAIVTIIFELSAPFLLLRKQWLFLLLASGFHVGTAVILGIQFTNLWPCYIVLLPFDRWIPHFSSSQPPSRLTVLNIPLLLGIFYAGLIGNVHGWPFACYPTFHQAIPDRMPLMSMVVIDQHNQTRRINHHQFITPDNLGWGENWRLGGLYSPVQIRKLQQFWTKHQAQFIQQGDQSVQFFRSEILLTEPMQPINDLYLLHEQPLSTHHK